jgi:hypothetical protein
MAALFIAGLSAGKAPPWCAVKDASLFWRPALVDKKVVFWDLDFVGKSEKAL